MHDAEGMLQLSFKVYMVMYGAAAVAALVFGNIFFAIMCCLGVVLVRARSYFFDPLHCNAPEKSIR